jgi:hypothetical protein
MSHPLLSIRCPHCSFRFKVDRKFAGKAARCPQPDCAGRFRVPSAQRIEAVEDATSAELVVSAASIERHTSSDRDVSTRERTRRETQQKPDTTQASGGHQPTGTRSATKNRRADAHRSSGQGGASSGIRFTRQRLLSALGVSGLLLGVLGVLMAPNGTPNGTPGAVTQASAAAVEPEQDIFHDTLQPFVKKYCHECHSSDDPQAGIDFTQYDNEDELIKGKPRQTWEKVLAMLETGAMPPPDMDQPSDADRLELVAWLEDKLFNLDCDMINDPGRVTVRRLNRAEYNNTIRDLLGVDFNPADDFPSDDVGYGFDNIGDVLSLSPLLMEKYLDAAEQITAEAIPIVDPRDAQYRFGVERLRSSGRNGRTSDGFHVLASAGAVSLDYDAPVSGEYELTFQAKAQQHGRDPARMQIAIDRKAVRTFDVTGQMRDADYIHKMTLKAGRHRISAAFINDFYEPKKGDRNLYVGRFHIQPPISRERLEQVITAFPGDGLSEDEAVARVVRPFIGKAFRRPATDDEVQTYAGVARMALDEDESYEHSIQYAIQAVLISPSFLFRIETDEKPDDPMAERPVTDYEVASRLSYFLWSSMPDDTLFDLASRGELRQPDVLNEQVRRMLDDPKSQTLVDNFAEQWLNLRLLDEMSPDPNAFPDFDPPLRDAMKRETLMLFEAVMREDRSLLDFLDADFTFVNEQLARHYGMDGIKGNEFQKVSLDPQQRAGVLTHASILTLTSNPERTSPVKRGKWILVNILGKEPPPPPPGVPELEETQKMSPDASLREQLEKHRADPGCNSCHRTMDALGFGFENFDATGRWRDRDGDHDIDSSGELPGGETFSGPVALVKILKGRRREFSRSFTEKMLTYALGRGLEYYDRCAVDEILKRLESSEYRFSELILGIASSKPFLTRRGDGERE